MGAMQNEGRNPRGKSKKRGSANNKASLDAFAGGNGTGSADWALCDSELLHIVVGRITAMGGAVTFGLSRDLGAHSLTLMLNGDRRPLWFNGDADLNEELRSVADTLKGMVE